VGFSQQQDAAIKQIKRWLNDRSAPQVFHLFGYAGSGKTTMSKAIANEVGGRVEFACFTGKAALVLRSKGCDGARTIHRLIYRFVGTDPDGRPKFERDKESDVTNARLVIVDEVSMVGQEMGKDLLSFGKKILVLGDPAQLPPIAGEGFFNTDSPEVMLTEIHRQAQDNPIIRMSIDVTEGRGLKIGTYGDSRVVGMFSRGYDEAVDSAAHADQVLCGRNVRRLSLNRRIREARGLQGTPNDWVPVAGDKLVCLRNDYNKGFLNGSMWTASRGEYIEDKGVVDLYIKPEGDPDAIDTEARSHFKLFNGAEGELDWWERKADDEFTFGWSLTVHKSQGSQWKNVVLFDESRFFRENAINHLYTGITRASERITVVL